MSIEGTCVKCGIHSEELRKGICVECEAMSYSAPMCSFANEDLGEPAGSNVACHICGGEHPIEYGTSSEILPDGTWSEPKVSRTIGFFRCWDKLYLASVDGRLVR